jgi:choline dehydrogenase-like flavoprotein
MKNKHVNVVVVGAGPGGGIAAKELSEAGLSVVLFERGKEQGFLDHDNDELFSQRTTVLGNAYGPDKERHRRVLEFEDGSTKVVLANEGGYNNVAAVVGGGTLSYGAMAWRFMPQDFKMKTTYGEVEGSTLTDWPISYEDLEPYYEKAEWEWGVSGDMSGNPFAPPRKKGFPNPAFEYNKEGQLLYQTTSRLGLHPFPIPMLRLSRPYDGRAACIHNRTCVGFACPSGAKSGAQNVVIPKAIATGNCELRKESFVYKILTNDNGRATGVEYFDAEDVKQTQTADLVIVSSSATETARLLLNSKNKLFPNGLGNRYDWVGRNLQGHAYSGAFGLFDEELYDDIGPGATVAIMDFNHGNPGIVGGAMMANEFIRLPYLFSGKRPPGARRWGKEHKAFQRTYFKRHMGFKGPVQEMPMFDARVRIDPEVTDAWGIPTLRISGHKHRRDIETGRFIARKAEEILMEAGAKETWGTTPGRGVSGGQHQAGTCRMGDDPQTSVTNKYGQLWEIDNLFVCDGSLHVMNGGFNPSLTIMALSYWVSDYIKKEWKGTGFKS